MTPTARRRRQATVLTAAAAIALSACTGLPTSGGVHPGLTELPEPRQIQFRGDAPEPGDTAQEILSGFLRAITSGLSPSVDFSLARSYLTTEAADEWEPLEEVVIYATASSPEIGIEPTGPGADPGAPPPAIEDADAAHATVAIESIASLDESGVYLADPAPNALTDLQFSLSRVDGEWRISELPAGIVLSEATFSLLYREVPLYFWAPDFAALVPDLRFFPARNAAGYAVTELLAGPSGWLSSAVATRIPDGATLNVASSVVVEDDVARVDLSSEAQAASFEDRKFLYTQIAQTLLSLPSVRDVNLTMGGIPYQVPSGMPEPIVEPFVGNAMTALMDGRLVHMQGSSLAPIDGIGDLSDLVPSHPAVGYHDEGVVLLSGADTLVHVGDDGGVTTLATGDDLVPPSFDRQGWVWTAPRASDGTLLVTPVDGEARTVSAPWLTGAEVLDVRVSRDGARIAVLLRRDSADELVVAAVVRDAVGAPQNVTEPISVAPGLIGARSAAWVDSVTLAVLAQVTAESSPAVRLVMVTGPSELTQQVPGAVSVAAGNGAQQLYVGTSADRILARSGLRWELAAEGVTDPAFPG